MYFVIFDQALHNIHTLYNCILILYRHSRKNLFFITQPREIRVFMAPLKNAKWRFSSGVLSRYELGVFQSGGELALRKVQFL